MMRVLSAVVLTGFLAVSSQAAEEQFTLTGDNTKIAFTGYKPDGKHDGGFKSVTGTATRVGTDAATLKIALDIDMNTLYSDDTKLTGHLKSPDFFDVKTNPKAKFVTSKVEKSNTGYTVSGKLTINGKTKDVSFP